MENRKRLMGSISLLEWKNSFLSRVYLKCNVPLMKIDNTKCFINFGNALVSGIWDFVNIIWQMFTSGLIDAVAQICIVTVYCCTSNFHDLNERILIFLLCKASVNEAD